MFLNPVRLYLSDTEHKHVPEYLRGIRKSGSQVLPSLSHVTLSAISELLWELIGCPISCPFLRLAFVLN